MTFNVRYDEPRDGPHAWAHRRSAALGLIRDHAPHLIALQEPTTAQWQDIADALPGYLRFSGSTDDFSPDRPGGFVLTRRFAARREGVFWLSDTPSVAESESWPHDWGPRACAWIELHDRDRGDDLLFASTHFDTNGAAWLPSAEVVHIELDKVAVGLPILLAGDFNCPAGSSAHRYLCSRAGFRDGWLEAGCSDERVVTFNGFTPAVCLPDAEEPPFPPEAFAFGNYRIDWILVKGDLRCADATILRGAQGCLPSDHYAVAATFDWSF